MPAGPRLVSYKGGVAELFFFRRKAAEEKNGPGRIVERMLCSCKLRLRRDEPDGRLTQRPSSSSWPPSASCRRGQDLQLQRPCCGSVFFRCRRAAEEMNGLGQIARTAKFSQCEYETQRKSKRLTEHLAAIFCSSNITIFNLMAKRIRLDLVQQDELRLLAFGFPK